MRRSCGLGVAWVVAVALAAGWPAVAAEAPRKAYDVVTLAPGVHGFVWREPLADPIEGNSLIVVNDEDVLVVDATLLPSTARRLAAEVRKLTDKPVRTVVNTHWHDDHQVGNAVFRELWPGATFVAHRHTRTDAIALSHEKKDEVLAGYRQTITTLEGWLERGVDDAGKGFDEGRRQRAGAMIAMLQQAIDELADLTPVPPDLTFDDALVLHRGERTIEVRWLGLGNTRGDVVVFLPKERIVATGDLLVHPVPFAFGSYYRDWIATLGAVDALGADVLFPGHGPVLGDRAYLHQVQGLLTALTDQVAAAVADDATLDETRARVTLADWRETFAAGDPGRERAFDAFFLAPAVERAWRQARGEPDEVKGVD